MTKLVQDFIRCESGAAAIEYALIATMIALVMIGGASSLGNAIKTKLTTIATSLN